MSFPDFFIDNNDSHGVIITQVNRTIIIILSHKIRVLIDLLKVITGGWSVQLLSTAVGRGLRWALLDAYNNGRHKVVLVKQLHTSSLHYQLQYNVTKRREVGVVTSRIMSPEPLR